MKIVGMMELSMFDIVYEILKSRTYLPTVHLYYTVELSIQQWCIMAHPIVFNNISASLNIQLGFENTVSRNSILKTVHIIIVNKYHIRYICS